jgi:hypothetical protein
MEEPQGAGVVVKLNVGGHSYVTTASTLTHGDDNFFTSLLSGRVPSAKVDDAYFIDRNGRYFEPVLDYLRTGRWVIPGHLQHDEKLVLAEAEFFGVKPKPFVHLSDKSINQAILDVQV